MRLPGDYDLHRTLAARQETCKAIRVGQEEIGAFVLRETSTESERQRVRIEHARRSVRGVTSPREVLSQAIASVVDEHTSLASPQAPQVNVRNGANGGRERLRRAKPASLPASASPQVVGTRRVP